MRRNASFADIPMGPNVSRMLDRLGVLKTLEPHAVFPDALILVDASKR